MEVVGMSKDHYGLSKFPSRGDVDFILILSVLQNMAKSVPSVVQHQWSKFEQTGKESLQTMLYIDIHCQIEMASTAMTYVAKLRPSPRFLAQEEYIATLKAFFAPDNSQPWRHFLLYGMAGVGKTQICLKFIDEVLDNNQ
jgi:Cdc6-like AAA superfamily ATPase